MIHPYNLHARAGLWSLRSSWPHLRRAHTAALAAADDADRGTLQAWRPNLGGSGGEGDGLATAIIDSPASATASHYTRLVERVTDNLAQARWLVASATREPVATYGTTEALAAAIEQVDSETAHGIHGYLLDADRAIRRGLGLLPDHWPLPTSPPCPSCGTRMLRVQVSAPDTAAWTVVCTAGCRCRGDACPCGMAVRVEGVGHIWDRTTELVADELARLPLRRTRGSRERMGT